MYDGVVILDANGEAIVSLPTGLGRSNVIGVVARGNKIAVYVNGLLTGTVTTDSTYSSGQVGVATYNLNTTSDVVFSNAKVWVL